MSQEWRPEEYTLDEDDPRWGICNYCKKKVFVGGKNKSDLVRHQTECEYRDG
ncbi:hypothetical protein [Haladaptatus sp. CMAA 1911]|uniref:hypothetical protein n=1 Tax=unclassified Haladaptatus TaxID=2622732 RepID=UPI00375536B7